MKKNNKRGFSWNPFTSVWLINAVTFAALTWVFFTAIAALSRSDFFTVTKVIVREKDGVTSVTDGAFAYFKGRNIFSFNLKDESQRIASSFPSYRKIRLTRFLPDCIFVDFLKRVPVASLGGQRSLYLDEAKVLFEEKETDHPGLPVIAGMEKKLSQAVPGKKLDMPQIAMAWEIIREASSRPFRNFSVSQIDVSSEESLCFYLNLFPSKPAPDAGQLLEVRIGGQEIPMRMRLLADLLAQMRSNLSNIKYIDLRFKEPVIKFRNMQNFRK